MEYFWDSQDHLTKVYDGSNTVQYKYDLMGRRVAKKKNSGDWKWYFYDGLKVIVEGNATNSRTYYTNSPAVIGGIITDGSSWFHYDRLGNVVAQTGSDGAPTYECTMDAFGNVLQTGDSYSGYLPDSAGTGGGYHLTTKEFDSDSGLYYFNARWYDPVTGRFITREPLLNPLVGMEPLATLGYTGSLAKLSYFRLAQLCPLRWNTYAFCGNNPVRCIDCDGLAWTDILIDIFGIGAGIALVFIAPTAAMVVGFAFMGAGVILIYEGVMGDDWDTVKTGVGWFVGGGAMLAFGSAGRTLPPKAAGYLVPFIVGLAGQARGAPCPQCPVIGILEVEGLDDCP